MVNKNKKNKEKDAYLTAKIDRLFKTVFVNPDNTKFMNAILSEALEQEVKVLKFYPTELPVRNKKERVKVLDVLLKTKDKKYVHVR